ncbi:tetratricopeptide repeat protein [Sorangium sp. So ce1128]
MAAIENNRGIDAARREMPADAVARFTSACDRGLAEGCYNLGLMVDEGVGVNKDTRRAATLYRKAHDLFSAACDGGDTTSCHRVGMVYAGDRSAFRGDERDAGSYRASCDKGSTEDCYHLGLLFEGGIGVARDDRRAAALFAKACNKGSEAACMRLRLLEIQGVGALQPIRAGFDNAQADAVLDATVSDAAACTEDGFGGDAEVVVTFAPSGQATSASVEAGPFAGAPAGDCIATAFQSAFITPFEGLPVVVRKRMFIGTRSR